MAKTLLLAWSSPDGEAKDAAFNDWYTGTHVPQVSAALGSVTAVRRYRTADLPEPMAAQQPKHAYLAVYEIDTDDAAAAMAALGAGSLDMTDTMDVTENPPVIHWYLEES
jgi:EthD domain